MKTLVRSVGVLFLSGALVASRGVQPLAAAAAAQAPASGSLSGTASISTGRVAANTVVQLRNLSTGQLAGTTTTNAAGQFSFNGLNPGDYAVEVLYASGQIVGTSALVVLGPGAAVTGVSVTASAAVAATDSNAAATAAATTSGSRVGRVAIIGAAAAAAGVAGAAWTRSTASPSQ